MKDHQHRAAAPRPTLPTGWAHTPARIEFGADYNPEQWPRRTWAEDVQLMVQAGVTVVTVGVFSWAHLQPAPDRWEFGWLDEVLDLLHAGGVDVDLATATASPPPWLTTAHPEILPVDWEGHTLWPGGRQHWRPTSPVYREHALRLVERMALRYGRHPAVIAWHVGNELGCHNVHDYSDDAARAFRVWLRRRYSTLEVLNSAWGTAFWSQTYTDWAQILPPRLAATAPNPGQQLDFHRFSSDVLLDHYRAERDVIVEHSPDRPVTTNFMVMGQTDGMDYGSWAEEVDFVSNDHYLQPGPGGRDELSFSANLTGGLAGGRPWWLMEHATSAVNWRAVNPAKAEGELLRDAVTHVAHGADAVCFFQWRQSAAGAERFHSAMLPHAGADSALFRSVTELGGALRDLAPLAGTRRRPARVALLFDWPSWWATSQEFLPSSLLSYRDEARAWHGALLDAGVRVDVVPADTDLTGYRVVVAPMLHVVDDARAAHLRERVHAGTHLVATYFSGIVDENAHVRLGGHPGALREMLGIRIEEFDPLGEAESVEVDGFGAGRLWTDRIDVVAPDVEVVAAYLSGPQTGRAAITRRPVGRGSATWVSTRLDTVALAVLVGRLLPLELEPELPPGVGGRVELVVRERDDEQFWFLLARGPQPLSVPLEGDLLLGRRREDGIHLAPGGVAVIRRGNR